jgi:hypothetical protein
MSNVTEIATQKRGGLAGHVYDAFLLAISETSELDPEVLGIRGMSGKKYRRFINNLIRSLQDTSYLEIGSWAGSTLCSAINRNNVRATAIDNWSQFGGPKNDFLANVARFKTPRSYVNFIEEDFRKVEFSTLGEFAVYLFDGPHDFQDQYDGLNLALPALASQFVFIVDDWNWSQVRDGTMHAIAETGLNLVYGLEIRTSFDNSVPEATGENSDWHNGYFISVLSKP